MARPKFNLVSTRLLRFDGLVVDVDTNLSPGDQLQVVQLSRPIAVSFHRNRDGTMYVAIGREPRTWPEDWPNDDIVQP